MNKKDMQETWKNKKILVIGFGRSGQAAAFSMAALGAQVFVQDDRPEKAFDKEKLKRLEDLSIRRYFSSYPPYDFKFDLLILSPAVPLNSPIVRHFAEKGAEVSGELEMAYRISRGKFIAITGTNGKTTTTSLVGEIFKAAGKNTHVVGNIGKPVMLDAVKAESDDYLITEVSSFQLETVKNFKPAVSAILNLSPDHLDRHRTMARYAEAKSRIFKNQTAEDYLIINKDNAACYKLAGEARCKVVPFSRKEALDFGGYVKDGKILIATSDDLIEICHTDEIPIVGNHNVENVLAASLISYFAGISSHVIASAIKAFPGVEHRLEYCGTVKGVKYYNDSKGTNVDASITAIKAIDKNIILIAGGDAKGQNFDEFVGAFPGKVKKLLLMGRDADLIVEAAKKQSYTSYEYLTDMSACVKRAAEIGQEGDTVLLSPACASWDMYENYEQRGRDFKDCVKKLSEDL